MAVLDFYDTSALLTLESFPDGITTYISHYVVGELEHIKSSNTKSEDVRFKARQVVRSMLESTNYISPSVNLSKLDKIVKNHNTWQDNTDSHILAEALYQQSQGYDIIFYTSDSLMYLLAREENFYDIKLVTGTNSVEKEELYSGYGKFYPNESEMAILYSSPKMNILHALPNQYCQIYDGSELKDVLRWTGEEYVHLNYKPISSAVGTKWAPLNTHQKELFDLLQNDSIPVKLALGSYGSGKTSLMLTHALNMIQTGRMDGLVFIRNNIELKDTTPLGALPNDEVSKLYPFLMPIVDHVGQFTFEQMLNENIIEPTHLGFIRGRSIGPRKILFIDEAENLTAHQVQLLIGRIGQDSMLFMAGDLRQCDKPTFEHNSGIIKMVESLKGNPLFGMVKLQESVRSNVCKLADLMD